ncbi:nucleophile aminohydrolase, partial [Staphylotrichum tortipilum]
LRRVRNPILLAQGILERGEGDLIPRGVKMGEGGRVEGGLDVPSAQGHEHIHGEAAEELARQYGLEMVEADYFWTRRRWEEHVRGLEREKDGRGVAGWCKTEFLPQGTVGAVAVDAEGVVCVATSTGGGGAGPVVELAGALRGMVAECLTTPWLYSPLVGGQQGGGLVTTWSVAVSGTGNGDSFLRTAAARTVAAMARFGGESSAVALKKVTGLGGELQKSAGDRWGRTGEGEGGMIGIECIVVRDAEGNVVEARSELLQDYNCGGMFRAWVDEKGVAFARVFRDDEEVPESFVGEGSAEDIRHWSCEKLR